jgi:hypothetical protein
MAHNAYLGGSLAAWAAATSVTPAMFWALDQAQFRSINGDQGGTWAPSSAITIGGSGLTLTTLLTGTTASFSGNVTLGTNSGQTITVNGILNASASNFYGYVSLHDGLYVQNSIATDGTLLVGGASTFNGNMVVGDTSSDTLTVNAATTHAASTQLGTTASHTNYLVGQLRAAVSSGPVSADFSVTATSHQSVIVCTTLSGAGRNITLGNSGFLEGNIKIIKNQDPSNTINVWDGLSSSVLVNISANKTGIFMHMGASLGWILLLTA